jgi:hypothetical protein
VSCSQVRKQTQRVGEGTHEEGDDLNHNDQRQQPARYAC